MLAPSVQIVWLTKLQVDEMSSWQFVALKKCLQNGIFVIWQSFRLADYLVESMFGFHNV
jgi:hypothetical protein